ncbi:hypothetical protein A3C86_02345 [Candidatus Kaiserbacteria bacterium RIFCSPHIGHO2_02_FULL_49_16]|uniref:Pyridoxal phosphate homeostasis protein n=1 Tax=Candidatus Kaiserbacteria bacterium RIFCSPHIGHO2_02_FULL_49_16 TaxID=1798490 RepID=A0A1F6D9B8_9BACT|nr:MAG: hypothetical protein A3C86_02345 [Candidatus Kaiserbacteria bacterium RIFCSPHIGHO2_02_FULL_49_16]
MNKKFFEQLTEYLNRFPRKILLVAVTKYVGVEETNEVIKAGVRAIGENRVEDSEKKFPHLLPADSTGSPRVEKHFIGQIQSRKIKRIVELFDVIQSVGSIEHLQRIENEADKRQKDIRVLLQFNISGEERKGGFNENNLEQIIQAIASKSLSANSRELADRDKIILATHHIKIIGVMGMASHTDDEEIVRKQFGLLKTIRDRLQEKFPKITELSMGMSDDYKIALEEGATMLRIGRALFTK